MNVRHWTFGVVCAATLLTVIGCYSYHPYGYGGGAYPAYPGGTVAPGTVAPGSGGTFAPGTGGVSPTPESPGWQPGGSNYGGDAPTYDPGKDGVPDGGNGNLVPNYDDLNAPDGSTSRRYDSSRDFGDTYEQNGSLEESGNTTPFGEADGGQPPVEGASTGGQDTFLRPAVSVRSASAPETVVQSSAKTDTGPNPYKYDRENYSWLRGVVDYDRQTKTWNIIYSLQPDANDRFGGSMTLLGADDYPALENNDVVLVEGRVDLDHPDAFGKPQYRVEKLQRLTPAY